MRLWSGEKQDYETTPLRPDACMVLRNLTTQKEQNDEIFFLEIDEGTESLTGKWGRWNKKIAAYRLFRKEGFPAFKKWLEQEFAAKGETLKADGFRVLTINRSETGERPEERLLNLINATHAEDGGQQFWFTTFDALMPEDRVTSKTILTAPIWLRSDLDEVKQLAEEGTALKLADYLGVIKKEASKA